MSLKILGDGFDIHGGGSDLVFPHHENEIAQAVGAGHEFARHWIHNGMLNVNGEKMSKSLGNFTTLADVLDRYDPRAFRMLVLQDALPAPDGSRAEGARRRAEGRRELRQAAAAGARRRPPRRGRRRRRPTFRAAMDDDFDTPAAVAVVQKLRRDANIALDDGPHRRRGAPASRPCARWRRALGLELPTTEDEIDDEVADARRPARRGAGGQGLRRRSDRLRDELLARGIVLEDTPNGTVWRRA